MTVVASDFEDLADDLDGHEEDLLADLGESLELPLNAMQAEARSILLERGAVVSGTLTGTLTVNEDVDLRQFDSTITEDVPGTVAESRELRANAPWAGFYEYGTGERGVPPDNRATAYPAPEYPPYEAIEEWVQNRPVQVEHSVAAIAESIAELGTNPHPFMAPAWRAHEGQFGEAAMAAAQRSARRL